MGEMRTAPTRTVRRHLHPNPHCSPPSPPHLVLFAAISTPPRTVRRHHLPYLHPNPHCSPTISTPPRTLRRPTAPTHGPPFVPNQPRTVRRHHLPYLHPNPHCSPTISTPTRTVRRPSPLYRTLRRPVADLAQNVSDNIRCDVINPYLLTWRIWRILKRAYILLI